MENTTPRHPGLYPGYLNVRMIPADNMAESGYVGGSFFLTDDEVILDKFMQKCLCAKVQAYTAEYKAEEREWVDRMFFVVGIPEDRFVQILKEERDHERGRAIELETKVRQLENDLQTSREVSKTTSEMLEGVKEISASNQAKAQELCKKMERALDDMQKVREHFGNAAVDSVLVEEEA